MKHNDDSGDITTMEVEADVAPKVVLPPPTLPASAGKWVKLNKEQVLKLLTEYNQSNRPIRQPWIKHLTGLMNEAKFLFTNPDVISISKPNEKGIRKLLNGQHRLTGFYDSNLEEAYFYIMEDVDEEVYDVADQGMKRTPADILSKNLGTKPRETTEDGEPVVNHNKRLVTIALAMHRMQGNDNLPTSLRFNSAGQAALAQVNRKHIEPILKILKKTSDGYTTPVISCFCNAAKRYHLLNVLPLVLRYATEDWLNGNGKKNDPLKLLHQLIRGYNSGEKGSKRRAHDQQTMYGYAVAAIRSALCEPEHWVERLIASEKNFGDDANWERKILRNPSYQEPPADDVTTNP